MSPEFEPPSRKWNVLVFIGGILTAVVAIFGLQALAAYIEQRPDLFQMGQQQETPEEEAPAEPPVDVQALAANIVRVTRLDQESVELPGTPIDAEDLQAGQEADNTPPGEFTEEKMEIARRAWQYIANNWNNETGLVNSVDGFPSVTMWDQAAGMAGVVSAFELGLIEEDEFNWRIETALRTLANLPLYNNELPNKVYNTQTLVPVDYGQLDEERQIGWSAIDLGRLAIWLRIIGARYPQFTEATEAVWDSWDVERLTLDGQMYGTSVINGEEQYNQEGRLGYEDYAAYGLSLWGLDVSQALDSEGKAEFVDLYGVGIPYDPRDFETSGANNYVLTEPFVLDGIENGFRGLPRAFAERMLQAQEARFRATGQLTAVTEDNLDREPFFVYNTLYVNGQPWTATTDTRETYNHLTFLSTKASLGLHALFNTIYTQRLFEFVRDNLQADNGLYNGHYTFLDEPNTALTANNNGVVLTTMLYERVGEPLLDWAGVQPAEEE